MISRARSDVMAEVYVALVEVARQQKRFMKTIIFLGGVLHHIVASVSRP